MLLSSEIETFWHWVAVCIDFNNSASCFLTLDASAESDRTILIFKLSPIE